MERDLASDLILILFLWIHTVAAAVWIGGGIVLHFVTRQNVRARSSRVSDTSNLLPPFRQIVKASMWALVITGGILVLVRLSESSSTVTYVLVLATKVALVGIMFLVVSRRRRNSALSDAPDSRHPSGNSLGRSQANMLIGIGLLVFLLSEVLSSLADGSLFA